MYFVLSPEGGPLHPSAELRSLLVQVDIYLIDQLWGRRRQRPPCW